MAGERSTGEVIGMSGDECSSQTSRCDQWQPVRKKPVVVEARGPFEDPTVVETIEGDFEVDREYINEHGGFYLIRGVEGEVYPCGADIFCRTYQEQDGQQRIHEIWREWGDKAEENIAKWGVQGLDTLVLAATEELGELSQAYLESEYEDGDSNRIREEIDDLGALLLQLRFAYETEVGDER